MGRVTSKSKIVPLSRFSASSSQPPDFISGTYDSEIVVLNKSAKGRKSAKPQPWLVKTQKHALSFTAAQQFNYAIKNRCEVFSAWQYESFIGDGHTQPKYYLVRETQGIESIATKLVPGYTSMNELLNKKGSEARAVLSQPKNLKLFAEMLINHLWLAASDFKLDHIGVDVNGNLVCLDFGESLIPFQYQEHVYTSRGWNFSITPHDLLTAPFFTTYKSSHFFIERGSAAFPGVFDFLRDNSDLKQLLCRAILKRCIFPKFINFVALELFTDFEECADELQVFMTQRTTELCSAATKNPVFLEFMSHYGENAYEEIKKELLGGALANSRYFRNTKKEYDVRCLEELRFNFEKIATTVKLTRFESTHIEAVTMLKMLRQFCEMQYLRLKKIDETAFFKKGLTDKTTLFKRLLDRIDAIPFPEVLPIALDDFIHPLIKETAIVAHHRRYSKINTFFRHTESTSWKDFTAFFRSCANVYSLTIEAVLADKKSRAILSSEGIMVDGYNEYREATKKIR